MKIITFLLLFLTLNGYAQENSKNKVTDVYTAWIHSTFPSDLDDFSGAWEMISSSELQIINKAYTVKKTSIKTKEDDQEVIIISMKPKYSDPVVQTDPVTGQNVEIKPAVKLYDGQISITNAGIPDFPDFFPISVGPGYGNPSLNYDLSYSYTKKIGTDLNLSGHCSCRLYKENLICFETGAANAQVYFFFHDNIKGTYIEVFRRL